MKSPNQQRRTIEIDECETSIFSDGSIIINTAGKNLLCIDFHDMLILFEKANKFWEIIRENA
jgi:hypothetical protein